MLLKCSSVHGRHRSDIGCVLRCPRTFTSVGCWQASPRVRRGPDTPRQHCQVQKHACFEWQVDDVPAQMSLDFAESNWMPGGPIIMFPGVANLDGDVWRRV